MAASDLTPGARALLGHWGSIINAVEQRASTAKLAAVVRSAQDAEELRLGLAPGTLGGWSATDLGRVRALAAGYRDSMERFARAADGEALTGPMLGEVPWSRPLGTRSLGPQNVEVRARYDVISGQTVSSHWMTLTYKGNTPATVGDVRADVTQAAEGFTIASTPGELVTVGEIWLAEV